MRTTRCRAAGRSRLAAGRYGSILMGLTLLVGTVRGADTQPSSMPTTQSVTATPIRGLIERDGQLWQPVKVETHGAKVDDSIDIDLPGATAIHAKISEPNSEFDVLLPAVSQSQDGVANVHIGDRDFAAPYTLLPVRKLTVYILPHSHNDIGYTALQSEVELKQMDNIRKGIALAKKTADYPPGARFVWNLEGLWAADLLLQRGSDQDRQDLLQAIRDGQVGTNGMYANELTGLCRPEELLQAFRFGTRLSEQTGKKIDSAMLSDVPGMTWGTATAMSQAGIRYFSLAPNWFDRIGTIMQQWQDKPFWWISPSGKDRVLVWVPWTGYAMSHIMKRLTSEWVGKYQDRLDSVQFPYDITYIRWSGHGDNAVPDPDICEFVKTWNAKYAWPKFVISTTSNAFRAFEQKYGDQLPQLKGDLTPYWEDGAASSALETALARNASERLTQAESLFLLHGKADAFPTEEFSQAWRNAVLYSEHTWGAWCSVSDSENVLTQKQWAVKRQFAVDADLASHQLLAATAPPQPDAAALDLFNTTSWPRSELVTLTAEQSRAGDRVTDSQGAALPSQRLSSGALAIFVANLPPFSGRRLTVSAGSPAPTTSPVNVGSQSLDNGLLQIAIDPVTGDIATFHRAGSSANFAKPGSDGLNKYVYLAGNHLADVQSSGRATISVLDKGPIVARICVESDAPGCNKLTREYCLATGTDHLSIIDTVDKKRVALNPHPEDRKASTTFAQQGSKESVSFAFGFNVPDGQIHIDAPLAIIRPETDQLPGACKDWLPVGRWVDVSNGGSGVTLATLDAPLIELGQLSTLLGSQRNPDVWRHKVDPTQLVYSWVMNNHWGTNYRAYQEGPVTFRYALRPHDQYDPAAATTFATALSQPLILQAASGPAPSDLPLLQVAPGNVVVTALKPSDDGKAWIARLFNVGPNDVTASLKFGSDKHCFTSDLSEIAGPPLNGNQLPIPTLGLVTVRIE